MHRTCVSHGVSERGKGAERSKQPHILGPTQAAQHKPAPGPGHTCLLVCTRQADVQPP